MRYSSRPCFFHILYPATPLSSPLQVLAKVLALHCSHASAARSSSAELASLLRRRPGPASSAATTATDLSDAPPHPRLLTASSSVMQGTGQFVCILTHTPLRAVVRALARLIALQVRTIVYL